MTTNAIAPYLTNVDIANRALQYVGARRIASMTEVSLQATEIAFCYDKLRVAELRRAPWRFATRRAMLRKMTSTSKRFIPRVWDIAVTYAAGQIVRDDAGVYWMSKFAGNLAFPPGGAVTVGYPNEWTQYFGPIWADVWSNAIVYNAGEVVYKAGSPDVYYIATSNTITAATDPASGAPWAAVGTVTAGLASAFLEPAGPAMTVASRSRNMYALPNGFLRALPPDPKVESTNTYATSAALQYNDWQFEGDFIISNDAGPLLLRFVADISDVAAMDVLFAEGLACRTAYSICERLTQSNVKLQAIGQSYQKFIRDARVVNALEIASTEPDDDEYKLTQGPQGVEESAPRQPQQGG